MPENVARNLGRCSLNFQYKVSSGREADQQHCLPPSIDPLKAKPFSPTAATDVAVCTHTTFAPRLPPPFTLRSLDSGVGSSEEEEGGEGSKVPGLESHGD